MLALIAFAALILWLLPLLRMRNRNKTKTVQRLDKGARWGVLLEAAGYSIVWLGYFWNHPIPAWQAAGGVALLLVAVTLSFMSAAALGDLLRIDASLSTTHRLIRSGPYRLVRHPVYLSFLCLLLGTGVLWAPWVITWAGAMVFAWGTEIRARTEDKLLAERFGAEFEEYRRTVSGYIPFLR